MILFFELFVERCIVYSYKYSCQSNMLGMKQQPFRVLLGTQRQY